MCFLLGVYIASAYTQDCAIAWGKRIRNIDFLHLKIPIQVTYLFDVRPVYIQHNNAWILFGHDGRAEEAWATANYLFDGSGNAIGELYESMVGLSVDFSGKPEEKPIFDCWKKLIKERNSRLYEQETSSVSLKNFVKDLLALHNVLIE